jgi:hypothetical protein
VFPKGRLQTIERQLNHGSLLSLLCMQKVMQVAADAFSSGDLCVYERIIANALIEKLSNDKSTYVY